MSANTRKSVCIISFSPIYRDARVLRQIKYLSRHYDLTVIGFGDAPAPWRGHPAVKWLSIELKRSSLGRKAVGVIAPLLGRLVPEAYNFWYWRRAHRRVALALAAGTGCDAFHANDWEALPVAVEAAKRSNARVVFDEHEYSPLQWENRPLWKLLNTRAVRFTLAKYAPLVDASMTVAPAIADRYRDEFGLDPLVVLNVPESCDIPAKRTDASDIKLIHHGNATRDRRPETMIETIALCDQRYSLHFMLTGDQLDYIRSLKSLAARLAPGRVTFHDPVAPEEIVSRLAEFDVGFSLIAPTTFNYLVCLPNKFFDFVASGLPVITGPSSSMAELVRRHSLGWVSPSFDARDLAEVLNRSCPTDIMDFGRSAREAAKLFNSEIEMAKVIDIYHQLLPG